MGTVLRLFLAAALLSSGVVLGAVSSASATPPSKEIYFVNLSAMNTVIEDLFGAEAAARTDRSIVSDIDDAPPLTNRYGEPFVAIYSQSTLFASFRSLWSGEKDVDGFARFLVALNKAPAIRAMVATNDYSGCALVVFDLTIAHGRRYLDTEISAHRFQGCGQEDDVNDFVTSKRFPLD